MSCAAKRGGVATEGAGKEDKYGGVGGAAYMKESACKRTKVADRVVCGAGNGIPGKWWDTLYYRVSLRSLVPPPANSRCSLGTPSASLHTCLINSKSMISYL